MSQRFKRSGSMLVLAALLCLSVLLLAAPAERAPRAVEVDAEVDGPESSRSCSWLDYSCNIGYVWPIPDAYGDDFFNMRFTPPECCTLSTVSLVFYDQYEEFSNVSGSGVDIYVWDSDGLGFPGTVVAGPVNVPGASLQIYPNITYVSFYSYGLIFCDDFHVGYTVVDQTLDNIGILSDDGTCGSQRSSELYGGVWGLMLTDWGYDVNFLMAAEICCPDPCYATGDCDGNGIPLTVADLAYLANYLTGGPAPDPLYIADMNGSCVVDSFDLILYSDYFIYGISVFDPYGGYPVETCCDIVGPVSNLAFEQLDFLDQDGGTAVANSDWGHLSFDVVPSGDGLVRYLNISARVGSDSGWIVRNFAILPDDLMAPGRYGLDFDLNEVGIPSGTDVSSLYYGAEISMTLRSSNPNLPATVPSFVGETTIQEFGGDIDDGNTLFTGPGVLVPPYVFTTVDPDSVRKYRGLTDYELVPPVQEGHNECASGATARSLKWLSNEHDLGLGSAQSIQERLDDADMMDQGATGKQIAQAKQAYIEENNLPLEVHWWNSDSHYNGHEEWRNTPGIPSESSGDIDLKEWLKREMDKGQDIELFIRWGGGGGHVVTLVGIDPANNTVEYRDDETQGDSWWQQFFGDWWVKEAALVPLGNGEYGYRTAANRIISAHAESPKSFDVGWRYHPRYVDGWLTVYGTINCQTYDPPLFERTYVEVCHTYEGSNIPDWANDHLIIFEWDWVCDNVDSLKVARPVWDYNLWRWILPPLRQYLGLHLPAEGTILPCIGDEFGETQQIHTLVNIEAWLADPRPLQEEYFIDNGYCPDLPGYMIGTTPIVFDSLVGPMENPFSTTPYTGSLRLDADLTFAVEPEYITGDANGDGTVNITDAVYLINYIFGGGPPPVPLLSGDANCDGTVNITDAVYLITYIFGGGPPPGDPNNDGIPDC